jgi:tryptophanyl-tRNA synthetase
MSKSYGNVIPIFAERADLSRRVMAIVTDSRRPDEPKDPATCNVFALYRHLATPDEVADLAARYEAGTVGYRDAKELLLDAHERRFGSARQHFDELNADRSRLEMVLADGAHRARTAAPPSARERPASRRHHQPEPLLSPHTVQDNERTL